MISTLKIFGASLCILLLCSCISLGDSTEMKVYSPNARIEADGSWPSASTSLVVIKPLASNAIDTRRIVVRPSPDTMNVYAEASWSEPVPSLIQNAVVHGFEDSGKIRSVGRQTDGLRSDLALLMDVRHFESAYAIDAKTPDVLIEIHAKLLEHPSAKVRASKTFRVSVPAADKQVPAVVNAFEQAMKKINAEIIGWTLSNAQR
jgi:cholesterol transport system auxiliary component